MGDSAEQPQGFCRGSRSWAEAVRSQDKTDRKCAVLMTLDSGSTWPCHGCAFKFGSLELSSA